MGTDGQQQIDGTRQTSPSREFLDQAAELLLVLQSPLAAAEQRRFWSLFEENLHLAYSGTTRKEL
jgi:hypothetical protein